MRSVRLLLFLTLLLSSCTLRREGRETLDFTQDWKFSLGDSALFFEPNFEDSTWRTLNLPHDWSIESDFSAENPATPSGGALPGGIGWYRKVFTMDESCENKCVFIEFDGVYRNSKVWINGHLLGERPYGYSSFRYELTPYINIDKPNLLAVRVDNSKQPNARWYTGSGIYRNVRLVLTHPVFVDEWGTFVTTPTANETEATVEVATTIRNKTDENEKVVVEQILLDQKGREVGKVTNSFEVAGKNLKNVKQTFRVDKPKLWTLEDPNMYSLITNLFVKGEQMDSYTTPVGIRTFKFDVKKGFILNRKKVKINGVCLHHDLGALGAAVNTRAIKRQLKMLKAMGCNAIRTSHNPPAPELLDLCDQLGMIVMDEAFDVWRKSKTPFDYSNDFDVWSDRDLTDMVRRDRNHPSVFIWSIGNEIGEQWSSSNDASAILLTKHLSGIVKSLDPTRPVTAGNNETSVNNPLLKSNALDIVGFNYHQNEYATVQSKFPNKPFIATETVSALMTRGFYSNPSTKEEIRPLRWDRPFTDPSQQCSSYDNCHAPWGSSHEENLKIVKKYPHIAGQFVWTGFDYIGEPTPYGWPSRSSFFGIIDLAGFPKDIYYLYQSEWTKEKVLHVFPHWNWNVGQTIDIWAYYNNADEVELYLNDKSLGKRSKSGEDMHVMWRVPFEAGTLKAVSRKKGKTVLVKEIKTAGSPVSVRLTPESKKFVADGKDLTYVVVELLDKDGNVLPNASNDVIFTVKGEGQIVGTDNGNPNEFRSLKLPERKLFYGKCVVIIQSTTKKGDLVLSAKCGRLPMATLELKSQ